MGEDGKFSHRGGIWLAFTGEFVHSVDDRGRVAIPAKFRPGLADGMVLTRGFERCIVVWPMDQWRLATETLRRLPYGAPQVRQLYRVLLAGATEAVTDRLGRILIPGFLRRYAELGDQVVVAGLLDRIEIWSETNWETVLSAAEAQGPQLAEDLLSGEFGREQHA